VTKSWPSQAEEAEAGLDVEALVVDAVKRAEKADIG
jgi:hypothetical protein